MNEKLMVDRACFERGCMGLPNPHERLIKEDEVVWLVEGREWVGLTEDELIVIKGKTCPEIDWSARHGVALNNGEQNAWLFTWFMAFAKETEAKLKEKNT